MHGAIFVPIILGSETTVSVGTGHTAYYSLYIANGIVFNIVRRAHENAVTLLGFLAIPTSTCLVFHSYPALTKAQLIGSSRIPKISAATFSYMDRSHS